MKTIENIRQELKVDSSVRSVALIFTFLFWFALIVIILVLYPIK